MTWRLTHQTPSITSSMTPKERDSKKKSQQSHQSHQLTSDSLLARSKVNKKNPKQYNRVSLTLNNYLKTQTNKLRVPSLNQKSINNLAIISNLGSRLRLKDHLRCPMMTWNHLNSRFLRTSKLSRKIKSRNRKQIQVVKSNPPLHRLLRKSKIAMIKMLSKSPWTLITRSMPTASTSTKKETRRSRQLAPIAAYQMKWISVTISNKLPQMSSLNLKMQTQSTSRINR